MIEELKETLPSLVADANLAPSVHNIQPSRWRLTGDRLQLLGDPSRAIPVADPTMRDWRLSHGAQFEGMCIALGARGYGLAEVLIAPAQPGQAEPRCVLIAEASVVALEDADADAVGDLELASRRQSWRGTFQKADQTTTGAIRELDRLRPDCVVISAQSELDEIAGLYDAASMHFLRDAEHRRELVHWMRLSASHNCFDRDGLNATAMNLGALGAKAAGLVLGPLFWGLDATGLAKLLLSESNKCRSAAAVIIMVRPIDEDPFETGRHFYRLWLEIERVGLKGCPMSVLIDWDETRRHLEAGLRVQAGMRIGAIFRVGVPSRASAYPRARLSANELVIKADCREAN